MTTTTHPGTMAAAETLRRTIAQRRDRLVWIQRRRGYSAARADLIRRLATEYDSVLGLAVRAGAEEVRP